MAEKTADRDETLMQAKFYLPAFMHDKLRKYARRKGKTMSVIVREVLADALAD